MKTKDNQLPILSGTYKDHKKVEDEVAGPDLRPIMGATVGPNVGLANFIGDKVVRKVAEMEDVGNVCKSTEEIQHHFEKYNKGRISKELGKKKMIVGSMDIEKYYPRLIAEPAAKKFKEMMIKSDLEFDGIDYVEVSKYLAKNMSKEEKEEESMEDILHIKKVKVKTSKLTKEAIVNNEKESKETNTVDEKEKENDVNNGKESEENIVNKEKEIKETMDTENSGGNKNNVNETKENEVKTLDTPQSGGKDEDKESDVNKEKENETKETLDTENGGGTKEKGNKTKSKEMTTLNNGGNQIDVNETNYDNENENETNKAVNNDEKENKNENGSTNNVDNKDTLPSEDEKAKNKNEEFDPPKRDSSEQEKKCMLAKAMEIMIIAAMKNHTYKFGNKIRIQKFGGPIGLSLTGELADCVMIDWDKLFLIELNKLGISPEIYERFKDDITLLMESMEKGTMFKDGKLIVDLEKKVLDEEKSDDAVTMEVIQEIANSINPMFQFTVDTPSNHENGKLPILDLQVKINEEENNRLDFEFYEKPLKNKKLILSDSAIPAKDKRTILTQECLRRLRNTKVELGKDVQNKHLNEFMVKMKNSGYNQKYRKEVLESALSAFEKMKSDEKHGIKPLYRSRDWNHEERNENKQKKKVGWYKNTKNTNIEYKTVLFVPITKGGALAKEIKQREEELNKYSQERIKIVESGGIKIKDFLIKKDPFPKSKCQLKKCFVCASSVKETPSLSCNTNNVGYRLFCNTCKDRGLEKNYEGESSRSARLRGNEHYNDFIKKKPNSALFKHKMLEHPEEEISVGMEITKPFKDALSRQANEAVRINNSSSSVLLNSKTEFNHPPIARITVERKNKTKHNFNIGVAQSKKT